ncbi:MAG: hypothetical protein CME31_00155 [Gimesia sp.]|jgi:hypothetical protein|nr:hypothetical protein [Gimesia sp.]|tara:strand:- start:331 stop:999 length:669 start_codon:yes stop_codon:yes gene_type:complete
MATSGTKTFSLDTAAVMEEAYELAGLELRTGYDAVTARRSLNIMFSDWANRGVNVWTIAQVSLTLTEGTANYTLNSYDIDIVDAVLRRTIGSTVTDIQMTSVGREEYLNVPTKETKGRPIQYFLDRQSTPILYLWPTPENSTDIFLSNRIQRMDDINASVNDPDLPSRFIAPMVSGLAFYIAVKKNPERVALLKPMYEEDFARAIAGDQGRASLHLVPARTY